MARTLPALVLAVLALVIPAAGRAATVEYLYLPDNYKSSPIHGVFVYGGAEADDVLMTIAAGQVEVVDATAPLTAGEGCAAVDAHRARCAIGPHPEPLASRILGGDGDDRLRVEGVGTVDLHGDAGNDTVKGGPGAETLEGGPGVDAVDGGDGDDVVRIDGAALSGGDTLAGGAGIDWLTVTAVPGSVAVDLAEGTLAGAAVTVPLSGFENVGAGFLSGQTIIRGDEGPNVLAASSGDPTAPGATVDGRGGDDQIRGGFGSDRLIGGDGNDRIAFSSTDVVDGGAGDDLLTGGEYGPGMPVLPLSCGAGEDAVEQTGDAVGAADCEQLRLPGIGTAPRPQVQAAARVLVDLQLDGSNRSCGISVALNSTRGRSLVRSVAVRLRRGQTGPLGVRLPLTTASRLRARAGTLRTGRLIIRPARACPKRTAWSLGAPVIAGATLR